VIPLISVNKRIEPLNSRTKDWRGTLSEDDRVEVQVSSYFCIEGERKRLEVKIEIGV
jgi:hypothetical protein